MSVVALEYKTTDMILDLNINEKNYYFPGFQVLDYRGEMALWNLSKWAEITKAVAVGFYQLVSRHSRAQAALLSAILV